MKKVLLTKIMKMWYMPPKTYLLPVPQLGKTPKNAYTSNIALTGLNMDSMFYKLNKRNINNWH
jgi:hypothetical protein